MHEPVRRGAELGLANPESCVDSGSSRGGELAREPADGVSGYAGAAFGVLGGDLAHERRHRVDAVDIGVGTAGVGQSLLDDDVRHRREQEGIGARPDEDVLIGDIGGLGATRIHDHETATALPQPLQSTLDVRSGHDRAVGHERVAADHEEEVGAVDIGHRQEQRRAEEQVRQQVLRLLVDARGGIAIAGAEGRQELRDIDDRCPAVGDRVAEVEADGVAAMALADVEQSIGDEVERLLPGDLLPGVADLAHGAT